MSSALRTILSGIVYALGVNQLNYMAQAGLISSADCTACGCGTPNCFTPEYIYDAVGPTTICVGQTVTITVGSLGTNRAGGIVMTGKCVTISGLVQSGWVTDGNTYPWAYEDCSHSAHLQPNPWTINPPEPIYEIGGSGAGTFTFTFRVVSIT